LESIRAQKLFSKATRFLFNEAGITLQSEEQQVYELAHLDQLYVTACRLYHDLNLTNHKYIAYQLALLYVRFVVLVVSQEGVIDIYSISNALIDKAFLSSVIKPELNSDSMKLSSLLNRILST
jgi:hypothetical protein